MNCGRLRSKNGVCLFRPTPFATHSSVITRTQNLSLKCNFIFVLIIMLSFLNNHIFCSEGVFLLVTEKSLGTKKTNQYLCLKHLTMSIQRIETSPLPFPRKKSPRKPTHYVPLKYSYLSEWWWREVPLKEWSHSKWPTKISKKPPARASLAVALISLLSTQDIPKCQLTVTFGTS